MKELKVYRDEGSVDISIIDKYEEEICYKFPKAYKELISKHNALYPEDNIFSYFDEVTEEEEENAIVFYAFDNENLDPLYRDGIVGDFLYIDEDYFQKGVIPFGETGNGDFICFDYRDDLKEGGNPKIVLVHHDAFYDDDKYMISFLANSFEEFVDSLYEDRD